MRILALLTDGFGAAGGIARYNQDLMLALSLCSDVSEVIALPRFSVGAPTVPAKVRQLAPSAGRTLWSVRSLALTLRQEFNAVFCGHLYAVPLAAGLAHMRRVPLWVQVHGIEAWQRRGIVHQRALATAALVTSVSRYTRTRLLSWADVAPHRVRVLPNTFSARYAPRPARADLIDRLGLAGRRVILTVGRLSTRERYKGHDRLIAAMPAILSRVPDAVYLIVGSGDDRSRLERLALETGVAEHVVLAGHVQDVELPDYFSLAHVFAMPSTGEGFGIVFIEAAASGLPVIGGNRDGSSDALAEGCIGRLVNPHSRAEIEATVVGALEGRYPARAVEVQRFSFSQFASHVDELVHSLTP
jgi:phosphatidylinositol alpha-1,6-mannosyltransferase